MLLEDLKGKPGHGEFVRFVESALKDYNERGWSVTTITKRDPEAKYALGGVYRTSGPASALNENVIVNYLLHDAVNRAIQQAAMLGCTSGVCLILQKLPDDKIEIELGITCVTKEQLDADLEKSKTDGGIPVERYYDLVNNAVVSCGKPNLSVVH